MKRLKTFSVNKKFLAFAVLIVIFLVSLALCLFYRLNVSNYEVILKYIRIPIVIRIIVSGAALALAGMLLQAISKNNLADPYLTGLSSGAGLGIVISMVFFNSSYYSLFGFIGAILTAFLVIFLSGFSKFSITKLILIGLSVNLFVGSIISFFILTNPQKAYLMTLVLSGGFSSPDSSEKFLLLLFLAGIIICGIFIPVLNLMRLDDRIVFSSLVNRNKYNIIFVLISAFLTSISVYSIGILGFVGIICPLFCKLIFGYDARLLFFGNILSGSALLLLSNFISQNAIFPLQIPLGVVIAIVGVPFFVFFLLREGRL